jgi:hypothetical protein
MLRGWRRGRVLQRLRAAGARSGRERGPVHEAAAARPSPAIRSQEQTGSPGRSNAPATACNATDGAIFRVRRSLRFRALPGRQFRCLHRLGRIFTTVLAGPGAISAAAFRISAVALDSVERRGRRLQIGGTKLVQCLPANRLSEIELSLRRSSHGSAARSSMVSSHVLRRRQMIATLARALSRVRRPATDIEDLKTYRDLLRCRSAVHPCGGYGLRPCSWPGAVLKK